MTGLYPIYYVRHGESGANVDRAFSCRRLDPELTAQGYAQARQAAELLANDCVGSAPVFASPLRRAIQTATTIGERLGRSVEIIEELRELDVGDLEGRTYDEALDDWWKVIEAWAAGNRHVCFPAGESHIQLTRRVEAALAHVVRTAAHCPCIVVAHAGLLRAGFMAIATPPPPIRLKIPNGSVSRLEMKTATGACQFAFLARSDFLTRETGTTATRGSPTVA